MMNGSIKVGNDDDFFGDQNGGDETYGPQSQFSSDRPYLGEDQNWFLQHSEPMSRANPSPNDSPSGSNNGEWTESDDKAVEKIMDTGNCDYSISGRSNDSNVVDNSLALVPISNSRTTCSLEELVASPVITTAELYLNEQATVQPLPSSDEEHRQIIDDFPEYLSLKEGKTYFLIDVDWYRKWKMYLNRGGQRPLAIDNSSLFEEVKISNEDTSIDVENVNASNINDIDRCEEVKAEGGADTAKTAQFVFKGTGRLEKSIPMEDHDFKILEEQQWKLLHGWYGGGPEVKRLAVADKHSAASLDLIGISCMCLKNGDEIDKAHTIEVNVRKNVTVGELKGALAQHWGLPLDPDQTCLWDYYNKKRFKLLIDNDTLGSCQISRDEDQELLLESRGEDGNWVYGREPEGASSIGQTASNNGPGGYGQQYPSSSYSSGYGSTSNVNWDVNIISSAEAPARRGLVGLANLGNTCFMNSIIQCMSASTPLRDHFLHGAYEADLNRDNVLGHGGKVAKGFAELMKVVYSGDGDVVSPRAFKRLIGDICPQFQGYNQHDSQELLNFLLDGLHEDTNRILVKECTDPVEAKGRSDNDVAKDFLEVYKKRNESCMVDLCSGQFKSTVVCPDCKLVSKTFDPYFSVSLPLVKESATEQTISAVIVRASKPTTGAFGQRSMSHSWTSTTAVESEEAAISTLESNSSISENSNSYTAKRPIFRKSVKLVIPRLGAVAALRAAASLASGVPVDRLIVTEIYQNKLYKIFEDTEAIEDIRKEDEIVIFEVGSREEFEAQQPIWRPLPQDQRTWHTARVLDEHRATLYGATNNMNVGNSDGSNSWVAFDEDGKNEDSTASMPISTNVIKPGDDGGAADDTIGNVNKNQTSLWTGDQSQGAEDNKEADVNKAGDGAAENHRNPWISGEVWEGSFKANTASTAARLRLCRLEILSDNFSLIPALRDDAVSITASPVSSTSSSSSLSSSQASSHMERVVAAFSYMTATGKQGCFIVRGHFDKRTGETQLNPIGSDDDRTAMSKTEVSSEEISASGDFLGDEVEVWVRRVPQKQKQRTLKVSGVAASGDLCWGVMLGSGSGGGYLALSKLSPAAKEKKDIAAHTMLVAANSSSSNLPAAPPGYVNVNSEDFADKGVLPPLPPLVTASGEVVRDDEDEAIGASESAAAGGSGESNGAVPDLVVRVALKRTVLRYGMNYSDFLEPGPLILTLPGTSSEREVRKAVVAAAEASVGVNFGPCWELDSHIKDGGLPVFSTLGFTLRIAGKNFEEEPRSYNNERIGDHVGLPHLPDPGPDSSDEENEDNEDGDSGMTGNVEEEGNSELATASKLEAKRQKAEEREKRAMREKCEALRDWLLTPSRQLYHTTRRQVKQDNLKLPQPHPALSPPADLDSFPVSGNDPVSTTDMGDDNEDIEEEEDGYSGSYNYTGGYYSSYYPSYTEREMTMDDNHLSLVLHFGLATVGEVFRHESASSNDAANNSGVHGDSREKDQEEEKMMTLSQCLDLFAMTEQLSSEDSWYCPHCKDHKEATKKLDLWSVPPLLCIHLKRFSQVHQSLFSSEKLETPVNFPVSEKLNLAPFIAGPQTSEQADCQGAADTRVIQDLSASDDSGDDDQQPGPPQKATVLLYNLVAVSNHFGSTGGGHYTAYGRNTEDGEWYEFDDRRVTKLRGEEDFDKSAAYVLFYLRDDHTPKSLGGTATALSPEAEASDQAELDNDLPNLIPGGDLPEGTSHQEGESVAEFEDRRSGRPIDSTSVLEFEEGEP